MNIFISDHAAEQFISRFHPELPAADAKRKLFRFANHARRTKLQAAGGNLLWQYVDEVLSIDLVVKPDYQKRAWIVVTVLPPVRAPRPRNGEVVVDPDWEIREEHAAEEAAREARRQTALEALPLLPLPPPAAPTPLSQAEGCRVRDALTLLARVNSGAIHPFSNRAIARAKDVLRRNDINEP